MKTFLVVAAVLGITSSAAFAECAGHKVTASNEVDKTITTASVASTSAQEEMKQAGPAGQPTMEKQKVTQ